jgi:hypothetical protein
MFRFISAHDGEFLGRFDASSATWACNIFLARFEADATYDDVVCIDDRHPNHRVAAVISCRGKRKPDVMVLDYMREQILRRPA